MIENYFKPGIRLKWTAPGDVRPPLMDGAIVDSTRAPTPMIYDGLDGELIDPHLIHTHVRTIGLSMRMPIQYSWLDYTPGRTSRCRLGARDVLTGFMSGCIIARWQSPTGSYVGHVGTIDSNKAVNREVKKKFAFAMPKSTTGFDPAGAWRPDEIMLKLRKFKRLPATKIMALVTTTGDFYSVLMLNLQGNEWCVGGSKQVQPIRHDKLKLTLMHYD